MLCFFVEVSFTGAPGGDVAVGIKLFRTGAISIGPEWFFTCDKFSWYTTEVFCALLSKSKSKRMRHWSRITFIQGCYPWLFCFFIEICFTCAPGSNVPISIKFFRTSSVSIGPERFFTCNKFSWYTCKILLIACNLCIEIII